MGNGVFGNGLFSNGADHEAEPGLLTPRTEDLVEAAIREDMADEFRAPEDKKFGRAGWDDKTWGHGAVDRIREPKPEDALDANDLAALKFGRMVLMLGGKPGLAGVMRRAVTAVTSVAARAYDGFSKIEKHFDPEAAYARERHEHLSGFGRPPRAKKAWATDQPIDQAEAAADVGAPADLVVAQDDESEEPRTDAFCIMNFMSKESTVALRAGDAAGFAKAVVAKASAMPQMDETVEVDALTMNTGTGTLRKKRVRKLDGMPLLRAVLLSSGPRQFAQAIVMYRESPRTWEAQQILFEAYYALRIESGIDIAEYQPWTIVSTSKWADRVAEFSAVDHDPSTDHHLWHEMSREFIAETAPSVCRKIVQEMGEDVFVRAICHKCISSALAQQRARALFSKIEASAATQLAAHLNRFPGTGRFPDEAPSVSAALAMKLAGMASMIVARPGGTLPPVSTIVDALTEDERFEIGIWTRFKFINSTQCDDGEVQALFGQVFDEIAKTRRPMWFRYGPHVMEESAVEPADSEPDGHGFFDLGEADDDDLD